MQLPTTKTTMISGLEFTEHFVKRMRERKLSADEIVTCLEKGKQGKGKAGLRGISYEYRLGNVSVVAAKLDDGAFKLITCARRGRLTRKGKPRYRTDARNRDKYANARRHRRIEELQEEE